MGGCCKSEAVNLISDVAFSNLYTMLVASKADARNAIPAAPTMPDEATRKLRAQLILEEAMETISALGFAIGNNGGGQPYVYAHGEPETLEDVIDGCIDTIYVAVGTLCACGVPDLPHMIEVNRCNNAKFPDGKAVVNANGKFLKPEGWTGPDHTKVMQESPLNLKAVAEAILESR